MTTAIYLRKSRADLELEARGEMETLARHRRALLELAQKMNLSVGQIYEEIVSGETIDARPVVRQLLDEVELGEWEAVLVMEVERLARGDTIDQGIVARAFKIGRAKIITPAKTYDPDNEFDEEYFEFGLFMSRREYKTINRRIQRGRRASVEEGKFIGSVPPYGYEKVKISGDKGYTLAPHPQEADVVRIIFDMYASGSGMESISRFLDSQGIRPRHRNSWSRSTISDILSNPVYTSKLRWGFRTEEKYMKDGCVAKRRRVSGTPILVKGLHPAIISEDAFARAQDVRAKNTVKTTKNGLTLQNPLSGIVYCQKCGHLMTRLGNSARNPHATLICPNRYCDNVSAPIFLIEKKVLEALRQWQQDYIFELNNRAPDRYDTYIALRENSLLTLRQELERLNTQISNTYDLLEQGVYTVELFASRNKELAARQQAVKEQSTSLEKELAEAEKMKSAGSQYLPRFVKLLKLYDTSASTEQKNRILRELLLRVDYLKEKANTRGNLSNDNFELQLTPKLPYI